MALKIPSEPPPFCRRKDKERRGKNLDEGLSSRGGKENSQELSNETLDNKMNDKFFKEASSKELTEESSALDEESQFDDEKTALDLGLNTDLEGEKKFKSETLEGIDKKSYEEEGTVDEPEGNWDLIREGIGSSQHSELSPIAEIKPFVDIKQATDIKEDTQTKTNFSFDTDVTKKKVMGIDLEDIHEDELKPIWKKLEQQF